MIIQATPYGTKKEEPFAFTYSGDFTDERVDGIGDVTLNTSGQLVTTGQTVTVSVYILSGGGGAIFSALAATGGSGGFQTVDVELAPGTYDIVIGSGGAGLNERGSAGNGGDTSAFGQTSTGGKGGSITSSGTVTPGAGGSPNGNSGKNGGLTTNLAGPSPNGGSVVNGVAQPGGNGLVRITFS